MINRIYWINRIWDSKKRYKETKHIDFMISLSWPEIDAQQPSALSELLSDAQQPSAPAEMLHNAQQPLALSELLSDAQLRSQYFPLAAPEGTMGWV